MYLQELCRALASSAGNLFGWEKYLFIPVQNSRKPKQNKSQHPGWDVVWFWFGFPFEYFVLEFVLQDNVKQSLISEWHWFSWWRVLFAIDKLLISCLPYIKEFINLFHCPMRHSFAFQFYFPIFLYAHFSGTVRKSFLFHKAIFVLSRPLAVFPSIPLHTLLPPDILPWLPEVFPYGFIVFTPLSCCVIIC